MDGEPPSRVHSVRGRLTCKSGCLPPARGGRVPGLLASDAQRTLAALRLFKRIAAEQATSTCASAWFWRTVFLYSALISTRATHLQHPYWPGQKLLRYACEISVFCKTFFLSIFMARRRPELNYNPIWNRLFLTIFRHKKRTVKHCSTYWRVYCHLLTNSLPAI